jgi:hypothetical protein
MKGKDEIVEEVRTAKEAYAARFDYDLKRMFEDLKKHEAQNPAPRANLPGPLAHDPGLQQGPGRPLRSSATRRGAGQVSPEIG